jgi:hypothetical protein
MSYAAMGGVICWDLAYRGKMTYVENLDILLRLPVLQSYIYSYQYISSVVCKSIHFEVNGIEIHAKAEQDTKQG